METTGVGDLGPLAALQSHYDNDNSSTTNAVLRMAESSSSTQTLKSLKI